MSENKSYTIRIMVAIIGMVGVVGAAVISNWDNIFGTSETTGRDAVSETEGLTKAEKLSRAEKRASNWFASMKSKNVEPLVEMASPPFYFDNEILTSKAEIHDKYRKLTSGNRTSEVPTLRRMEVGLVSEFKNAGRIEPSRDRVLANMRIEDEDVVVVLVLQTERLGEEGSLLFFRETDDRIAMAGFWD